MSERVRSVWDNVDRTADPHWYRNYLDAFNAMETVRAWKERSFTMLAVAPGHHLLDVGCGLGGDAIMLAARVGAGGRVVGVDNSEQLIVAARERGAEASLPVEFRVGDLYALDFADAAFDGCRADRVFQHLDRPTAALHELMRVTKPGGRIVVGDPDWETLIFDAPQSVVTRTILNFACDSHRNAWMGRQLYAQFRAAGLADVTVAADTLLFTDYSLADLTVALGTRVRQAQDAEAITEHEAAEWLDALATAADAGRFFAAMTCFTVSGRKPEA
ncbi:MAG: methyltransferase domain-containing protein [Chloroflexota bacterium]|nr:methyltransferase domain-containing protein [Chloroflexota bacterium]